MLLDLTIIEPVKWHLNLSNGLSSNRRQTDHATDKRVSIVGETTCIRAIPPNIMYYLETIRDLKPPPRTVMRLGL